MKDNLIARYQMSDELKGELRAVWKHHGWLEYCKTKAFLKSIEGKVVDLVFTHGDAFEAQDNNYWLPDCLWVPVDQDPA
jgi:hypothetical protein